MLLRMALKLLAIPAFLFSVGVFVQAQSTPTTLSAAAELAQSVPEQCRALTDTEERANCIEENSGG